MSGRFDYRTDVIRLEGILEGSEMGRLAAERMSALGAEGWELVSVIAVPGTSVPETAILFYKRAAEAKRDAPKPARISLPRSSTPRTAS